jgi:hypothetical protein
MAATIHVIYDPTNKVQVGPPDKLPIGVRFIAMKCDVDHSTTDRARGDLVQKLARLLLEQL